MQPQRPLRRESGCVAAVFEPICAPDTREACVQHSPPRPPVRRGGFSGSKGRNMSGVQGGRYGHADALGEGSGLRWVRGKVQTWSSQKKWSSGLQHAAGLVGGEGQGGGAAMAQGQWIERRAGQAIGRIVMIGERGQTVFPRTGAPVSTWTEFRLASRMRRLTRHRWRSLFRKPGSPFHYLELARGSRIAAMKNCHPGRCWWVGHARWMLELARASKSGEVS